MSQKSQKKILALNVLGTLGYMVALLQWLWVLILFLPSILTSPIVNNFLIPSHQPQLEQPPVVQVTNTQASPVLVLAGSILGVVVLGAFLYVLVAKLPQKIATTGEKITHIPAQAMAPIVIKQIHMDQKQKKGLPAIIIMSTKSLLTLIPFLLLIFAQGLTLPLSFESIVFIGIILFLTTAGLFIVQFLLSRYFKIDYTLVR